MEKFEYKMACDVVAGDWVNWRSEDWLVKTNYMHPKSPYSKMSLWNERLSIEAGLKNITMYTGKTLGLSSAVSCITEEYRAMQLEERIKEVISAVESSIETYSAAKCLEDVVQIGTIYLNKAVIVDSCKSEVITMLNKLTPLVKEFIKLG